MSNEDIPEGVLRGVEEILDGEFATHQEVEDAFLSSNEDYSEYITLEELLELMEEERQVREATEALDEKLDLDDV